MPRKYSDLLFPFGCNSWGSLLCLWVLPHDLGASSLIGMFEWTNTWLGSEPPLNTLLPPPTSALAYPARRFLMTGLLLVFKHFFCVFKIYLAKCGVVNTNPWSKIQSFKKVCSEREVFLPLTQVPQNWSLAGSACSLSPVCPAG